MDSVSAVRPSKRDLDEDEKSIGDQPALKSVKTGEPDPEPSPEVVELQQQLAAEKMRADELETKMDVSARLDEARRRAEFNVNFELALENKALKTELAEMEEKNQKRLTEVSAQLDDSVWNSREESTVDIDEIKELKTEMAEMGEEHQKRMTEVSAELEEARRKADSTNNLELENEALKKEMTEMRKEQQKRIDEVTEQIRKENQERINELKLKVKKYEVIRAPNRDDGTDSEYEGDWEPDATPRDMTPPRGHLSTSQNPSYHRDAALATEMSGNRAFKSYWSMYLRAWRGPRGNSGWHVDQAPHLRSNEQWHIEARGDKVTVKSFYSGSDKYLRAHSNYSVDLTDSIEDSALWTPVKRNYKWGLQSSFGTYLRFKPDGVVELQDHCLGDEQFTIESY